MEIKLNGQARKMLRRMPQDIAARIVKALTAIAGNTPPANLDIRPVQGLDATFRLRIGTWRVIYTISANTMRVIRIKPRGDVYKR